MENRSVKTAPALGPTVRVLKRERPQASSSAEVFAYMQNPRAEAQLDGRERFWVLGLDVKNRVQFFELLSIGSVSATLVHPREVFHMACIQRCHSIIMVHNHPSGDVEPSDDDIALTRRLVGGGDVLGIKVLDHIILGDEDWYSFADSGRLRT